MVQLRTKAALDHETKSSYTVTVTVYDGPSTDSKTLSDTINVTIRVESVNEPPMFPSLTTTRSVPENAAGSVNIGIPVTATDPDADDSLTYRAVSGDEVFKLSRVPVSCKLRRVLTLTLNHKLPPMM